MTLAQEELLRGAYQAFNDRQIEEGVGLMDPDVEWPHASEGGFVYGRDEVRAHWREQFEQVDPRIELRGLSARNDGRVEAQVRQLVLTSEGEKLSDDEIVHVFTFADGLIKRMEIETSE
jgi:ketosteroid isomerase-like protein